MGKGPVGLPSRWTFQLMGALGPSLPQPPTRRASSACLFRNDQVAGWVAALPPSRAASCGARPASAACVAPRSHCVRGADSSHGGQKSHFAHASQGRSAGMEAGCIPLSLHSQPSTPAQSINPAPAFSRGWIVPQPNLPARIFLLRLLTADDRATFRLSGFRMRGRVTVALPPCLDRSRAAPACCCRSGCRSGCSWPPAGPQLLTVRWAAAGAHGPRSVFGACTAAAR
jgi:hypothetical protein